MLRKLLFALTLILATTTIAHAQATIAVDINTATLQWNAPSGGGAPTEYRVKCGTAASSYTLPPTIVPFPTTTVPVKSAIPSAGNYFCVVSAANQFGESPNSNEIAFQAGDVPLAPTNLVIQSR